MSRYPLNLPVHLKQEAEQWAKREGVSLNQFIVWAVAEKVGGLKQHLHDTRFPFVEYRIGASGWPTPVLRGTGIRLQTLAVASSHWQMSAQEIADDYDLSLAQVENALAFYEAHRAEIDTAIATEGQLEPAGA